MADLTASQANTQADDYNDDVQWNEIQTLIKSNAALGLYYAYCYFNISSANKTTLENAGYTVSKMNSETKINPNYKVSWS